MALWGDRVYLATVDAHLIALDALTGKVVWDTTVDNYKNGYYFTLAPLIAKGKVMVGTSGGELGVRGYIAAFDVADGKPVWKTYTIPGPGEPGNDTWPGDTWKTGGVSVWLTAHYDPQLNLSFWGTGNGAPWMGDMRPGDNLYSSSVLALDVDTGKIRGYHQYHWNDSWDWDEVSTPLLIDFPKDGRTVKGLVHPGRNGYLWRLERGADGIKFVDARPFVIQEVFTKIDPVTGRPSYNEERKPRAGATVTFCPGLWGGKDWTPAGYNPKTKYLYIPANENLCSTLVGQPKPDPYEPGKLYLGIERPKTTMSWRQGANHIGELQAWDMTTGQRVWTHKFPFQNWGPILTTGGGLVFLGGTNDRNFWAFDAKTRRRALEVQDQLRHHRRAELVRDRRRAVRRGAIGLGRRRPADAGAARHVPRHQDRRAAGRCDLGVRAPGLRDSDSAMIAGLLRAGGGRASRYFATASRSRASAEP